MINAKLTVSTNSARPLSPTINQDAQDIADGIASHIRQAVHGELLAAASLADAKIRRSLEGRYPAVVLDALAGSALAQLAAESKAGGAQVTANSARPHPLTADVRDLPPGD